MKHKPEAAHQADRYESNGRPLVALATGPRHGGRPINASWTGGADLLHLGGAFFIEIFARYFRLSQVALEGVSIDSLNDLGQFCLFFEEFFEKAWITRVGFYLLSEIHQPSLEIRTHSMQCILSCFLFAHDRAAKGDLARPAIDDHVVWMWNRLWSGGASSFPRLENFMPIFLILDGRTE